MFWITIGCWAAYGTAAIGTAAAWKWCDTLGSATTSGEVDLGAGNDRLTLGNGGNTLLVSNVETLKGGGQITEKESEFAANAIAKISRSTSYEEYTKELDRLEAYMKRLMDAAGRRAAGEDVPDITSGEAAAPSPAKPTGPTQIYPGYVNPKTGAKFKGGDWKDPANWEMPE